MGQPLLSPADAPDPEIARYATPKYLADMHPNGGVVVRLFGANDDASAQLFSLDQIIGLLEERIEQGFPVVIGGLV